MNRTVLAMAVFLSSTAFSAQTQSDYACFSFGLPTASEPFLPFYQPVVESIDYVENGVALSVVTTNPQENNFTVRLGWHPQPNNAPGPALVANGWFLNQWTGFSPSTPGTLSSFQRSLLNNYAQTAGQVRGPTFGAWMNTQDVNTIGLNGNSGNIAMGCWSNAAPPRLFPTPSSAIDVSWSGAVPFDGATGPGANTQAYFQLIAIDQTAQCAFGPCGFSLSVGFFGAQKVCEPHCVTTDVAGQGTLPLPLAWVGIGDETWIDTQADSATFQYTAFQNQKLFHFQITRSQFTTIVNAVKSARPEMASMSVYPENFKLTLINLSGEVHDPDLANPQNYAQLGLNASNLRVETMTPVSTSATRRPSLTGSAGHQFAFTDSSGGLHFAEWVGARGAFQVTPGPASSGVVGSPCGAFAGGVPRIAWSTSTGVFDSAFVNGTWTLPVNVSMGIVPTSSPSSVVGPDGVFNIFFADENGGLHRIFNPTGSAWHHESLSFVQGNATVLGNPSAFVAGSALRVAYRDSTFRVRQLVLFNGSWSAMNMDIPFMSPAYSDIAPIVDGAGLPHLIYMGWSSELHDVFMPNTQSWTFSNISSTSGAFAGASLAQPSATKVLGRIVVFFRDTQSRLATITYPASDQCSSSSCVGGFLPVRGLLPLEGDPVANLGSDGTPRVLYVSRNRVRELHFDSGKWFHSEF